MKAHELLSGLGLPRRDLYDLPDSEKRLTDGAQYRVEIPSVEGPRVLEAVIEEADRREVQIHRVSQGSGIMLLTDVEILEMCHMADRKSTRLNSSHANISYAVFCLKKQIVILARVWQPQRLVGAVCSTGSCRYDRI